MAKNNFYKLSVKDVLRFLKTEQEGLSDKEVAKRQQKHGPNKLPEEKRVSEWWLLIKQFLNPLIYILIVAAGISFVAGELVDGWVIVAAIGLNTVIGYVQESRARRAIEHLKKLVEHRVKVRREGREELISSEEVVPGDLMILTAGDQVVADGRLLSVTEFQVNEASLTGESLPITKQVKTLRGKVAVADRKNMVYAGTVVTQGKAEVLVTAIGAGTHLGGIAKLLKETQDDETPLQVKLNQFGRFISYVMVGMSVVILVFGLVQGFDLVEIFVTVSALAVAAIPEGLPMAMTIVLAVGMQRILRRKALVRNLLAAETLGSATVICADKTGTLTEGKMRLARAVTLTSEVMIQRGVAGRVSEDVKLALEIGMLCNDATVEEALDDHGDHLVAGSPTERALLAGALEAGLDYEALKKAYPRVSDLPFNSERKFRATLYDQGQHKLAYFSGAPDRLLGYAGFIREQGEVIKLTAAKRREIQAIYDNLGKQGFRLLGAAYRELPDKTTDLVREKKLTSELVFVGFLALEDPLRASAKDSIALCKAAGIETVMITGDHKLTAIYIAKQLGLKTGDNHVIEGVELEQLTDNELRRRIREIKVYARVTPEDKIRIVDAWQAVGEVVTMTGDGVNDAPALKAADIGVAVGFGTDVAKEASDMILLDNNFRTIVAAVEEGRVIFDNIRKIAIYLLGNGFTEMILIFGSMVLGWPLPLVPAQILWINLITDGLPNNSLTVEPGEPGVMAEKPRPRTEGILTTQHKWLIFGAGLLADLVLLISYRYVLLTHDDLGRARAIMFAAVSLSSLLFIFSVKSLRRSIFRINMLNNKLLLAAVLFSFSLTLLALYWPAMQSIFRTSPLMTSDWFYILPLGFIQLVIFEIFKAFFNAKHRYENH